MKLLVGYLGKEELRELWPVGDPLRTRRRLDT